MKDKEKPELQLQIELKDKFNKQGFKFQVVSTRFDLVDSLHGIVVEVKTGNHAPEQLLYAAGESVVEKQAITFVGLMNSEFALFFNCPSNNALLSFRNQLIEENEGNPLRPSTVPIRYRQEADEILGDAILICSIKEIHRITVKDLLSKSKRKSLSVNLDNLEDVKNLLEEYEINPKRFLLFIFNSYSKHRSFILINEDGWIFDSKRMIPFNNDSARGKDLRAHTGGYKGDYKSIKDSFHAKIICSLLIGDVGIEQLHRGLDHLEEAKIKRELGTFAIDLKGGTGINITEKNVNDDEIGQLMLKLCDSIDPDVVLEPYVGAGTLVKEIITSKKYQGALNDIGKDYVALLEKKYGPFSSKWSFTNFDLPKQDIPEILKAWNVTDKQKMLIITNPPYGTSSTNRLASTSEELGDKASRNLKIDYPYDLGDRYGRGDLLLPTIGKLIDICQKRGQGIIAFFSPHGIFCGRRKYNKLFKSLLESFTFRRGYLFSGKYFDSVASGKPIAFTIWEYGGTSSVESVYFIYNDSILRFRRMNLLKDYWRYDSGDKGCPVKNQKMPFLAVSHCETFNAPKGKFFSLMNKKRDGKLCEHTNKIKLERMPYSQELLISLWSTVVGMRSMTKHPLYLDNANVHLPDFCEDSVQEVVALVILDNLIQQLKSPQKYSEGHIGFDINNQLVFGDKTGCSDYASEVMQIITKFSSLPITRASSVTVLELFKWLQDTADIYSPADIKKMDSYRRLLKEEVSKRLWDIKYFADFIPFPRNF